MSVKKLGLPLMIGSLAGLFLLMILFPSAYLESALRGLAIWWDILFPSLFPFFIISEMMLGFGIVHLFGALLDPLMKPLFRIPGSGGFVAAMGYVSGYPVGARLTAKLWEQNMVTRDEGERLVAFTTSSDPIFLIGAVSVGFFHNPKIAAILAIAHYGGGLLIGLLMRFHGRQEASPASPSASSTGESRKRKSTAKESRIQRAFAAMHHARLQDGRNIGEMLRQALESSLKLIIVVGGLVVFFSAFLELLTQAGVMKSLYFFLDKLLTTVGFPASLSEALVGGIFEVTLGARSAGEATSSIPLPFKAAAAAFVLSWGGLSVHAQIASILHATNLRYLPFMIARLIHAIIAAGLVMLLWEPVMGKFMPSPPISQAAPVMGTSWTSGYLTDRLAYFCILIVFMTTASLVWSWIRISWRRLNRGPLK
ncbi:sporulation integral membrane protein YlbJ [Paenibacillus sp.]|jgi:sporulation integral membrane protein YlbJ|uniref:sporulation integral membrane protein YlbJ n=1 Tax=Paenibacillus sp. TaxID=58172 RepID=UPI002824722E|nr:sporulation integral membrane protein YlbJ [Paenibacillus sp.]MDR0266911.1 sporulation integral membrane protein YlbJ [Paenibacillus sp.]